MEVWHEKLLALVIIFTCIFLPSVLPIRLSPMLERRGDQGLLPLSIIACFGGGVFFGAYLMHMAPEVNHLLREVWMKENDLHFPYPELFTGLGFFLLLIIEQCMYLYGLTPSTDKKKSDVKIPSMISDENRPEVSWVKRKSVMPSNANTSSDATGRITAVKIVSINKVDPDRSIIPEEPNADCTSDTHVSTTACDASTAEQLENGIRAESGTGDGMVVVDMTDVEQHSVRKTIMLLVALSSDCVFEGMSLGLKVTRTGVWNLVLAILSHEIVITFLLSLELLRHYSPRKVFFLGLYYASTCPIGIVIGTIILQIISDSPSFPLISGVLQALCCGVFIYVSFIEILSRQFSGGHMTIKALAVVSGFTMMILLVLIPHGMDRGFKYEDQTELFNVTTEYPIQDM